MSIVDGDLLRVTVSFTQPQAGQIQNVYFFKASLSAGEDEQDVIDGIEAWVDDLYSELDEMSDSLNTDLLKIEKVEVADGVVTALETVSNAGFSLTSPPAGSATEGPQFIAAVVNTYTQRPQVRGRKYFGTWTNTASAQGSWSSGIQTVLAAAAGWLLEEVALTSGALLPGLISSKYLNGISPFFPLITSAAQAICAKQGKRKIGVGV